MAFFLRFRFARFFLSAVQPRPQPALVDYNQLRQAVPDLRLVHSNRLQNHLRRSGCSHSYIFRF